MSTTVAPVSGLTDEQRDFQAAIADFCQRELRHEGAARALTTGLHRAPQPGDLREAGRPRLARRLDRRGVRRLRRRAGRRLHLPRGDDACGSSRSPATASASIVAGAYERFGTDEQKQEILGGIAARPGRGDRDVGARGRVRRRQPLLQGRTRRTAASSSTARRPGSRPRTSPTTSWSSPRSDTLGLQARGPDDVLGADRRRGDRDPRDPDDGRQGGQRRLPHRLLRPGRTRCSARSSGGWMQLMAGLNVERLILAATCARDRAAGLRRRARLRQGAQAVRPADRLVPDAQAPDRRPRDRDRVRPPAGLRRRPQGRRRPEQAAARARPRWRS